MITEEQYKEALTIVDQYRKQLRYVSGSSTCPFCGGAKTTPFVRHGKSQDCKECDKDGKIKNRRLAELEIDDMIENYR